MACQQYFLDASSHGGSQVGYDAAVGEETLRNVEESLVDLDGCLTLRGCGCGGVIVREIRRCRVQVREPVSRAVGPGQREDDGL